MKRRSFITGLASGALTGVLGSQVASSLVKSLFKSDNEASSQNFVIFLADDLRWDAIGAAGNRIIHTPNLDALAANGTLFANNFVTTSIVRPAEQVYSPESMHVGIRSVRRE